MNIDPGLKVALLVIGIAVGAWFALHQMWIDTHCTMVLGTQVCR